jgi:hypothetical protein
MRAIARQLRRLENRTAQSTAAQFFRIQYGRERISSGYTIRRGSFFANTTLK